MFICLGVDPLFYPGGPRAARLFWNRHVVSLTSLHACVSHLKWLHLYLPALLPYVFFRISLCLLMPEPFHDLYMNIQKCQERKKNANRVLPSRVEGAGKKQGDVYASTDHFQDGFHTDCHLSPVQPWEIDRTSSVSMLRSRAEQGSETISLDYTKDGLVSESLLCPLCQVPPKKLNGSFSNPMDLDLFGVKRALCRIWPHVSDTRLGLSIMGFEFLLLNCSEEREGKKKPL